MTQVREPRAGTDRSATADRLTVVGVGLSEGGLDALVDLIRHVPRGCLSFIVVVNHLASHRQTAWTERLAANSRNEVHTACDGTQFEVDRIYIVPAQAEVVATNGGVRLADAPHPSIDALFRALSEDLGSSSIGVVLSGDGSDGTLGLRAIKAAGGVTFVQEPSTAKHASMPERALAGGNADFCLPAKEIGRALGRIGTQGPRSEDRIESRRRDPLGALFLRIRLEFGIDLSDYKPAAVEQRVEERMSILGIDRIDEYVGYVEANRDELHDLYRELLVPVTSFFRDPETFDFLKQEIFPRLLDSRANRSVRIWVPACATGEEAYSLGMCLLECCEGRFEGAPIQIFATDIDDRCIHHARLAVYPARIARDVSPDRLERHFTEVAGEFHVAPNVRNKVVFSRQNILRDPPFARIDLVSCRNLLIYLQASSQRRVHRTIHQALEPRGYALFGNAETASDAPELFTIVERKHKLYAKAPTSESRFDAGFEMVTHREVPPSTASGVTSLQGLADRTVLQLFAPPGVVISKDLEILQFRGDTGPYLDPAPGAASFNILRFARPDLRLDLERAIEDAILGQHRVTRSSMLQDGGPETVVIDVVPIEDPDTRAMCFLVLFQKPARRTGTR